MCAKYGAYHRWKSTQDFFVGDLYQSIYRYMCDCGAWVKWDGTVLEAIDA